MKCIFCGCSELAACVTDGVACSWFCEWPPVCDADPCYARFSRWLNFFQWLDELAAGLQREPALDR